MCACLYLLAGGQRRFLLPPPSCFAMVALAHYYIQIDRSVEAKMNANTLDVKCIRCKIGVYVYVNVCTCLLSSTYRLPSSKAHENFSTPLSNRSTDSCLRSVFSLKGTGLSGEIKDPSLRQGLHMMSFEHFIFARKRGYTQIIMRI